MVVERKKQEVADGYVVGSFARTLSTHTIFVRMSEDTNVFDLLHLGCAEKDRE